MALDKNSVKQLQKAYIKQFLHYLHHPQELNSCYEARHQKFIDVFGYCNTFFDVNGCALYPCDKKQFAASSLALDGKYSHFSDRDRFLLDLIHFKLISNFHLNGEALSVLNNLLDLLLLSKKNEILFQFNHAHSIMISQELLKPWLLLLESDSLLDKAEMALGIAALSGFLAVIFMVVWTWTIALIATGIAVSSLGIAVVLLTLPVGGKEAQLEDILVPKPKSVESYRNFTHSTQQILKSTISQQEFPPEEPGHYSSPLAVSKEGTSSESDLQPKPPTLPLF